MRLIPVTRKDGTTIWLNAESIDIVEPVTAGANITLHNGFAVSVKEAVEQVLDRIVVTHLPLAVSRQAPPPAPAPVPARPPNGGQAPGGGVPGDGVPAEG